MRTVIFIGLISIAKALRSAPLHEDVATFFAAIIMVAIVMDIAEFIKKMTK